MSLEATRLWVDRCIKHNERGVNALLVGVTRCEGDDEPPLVEVADWTRNDWAAKTDFSRAQIPQGKGLIVVVRASDADALIVPGNPEMRSQQETTTLLALYLGAIDAKTGKTTVRAEQDGNYTIRALRRATARWIEETTPNDRTVADVRLVELVDQQRVNIPIESGKGVVGSGLAITVRVTDMYAENITPS